MIESRTLSRQFQSEFGAGKHTGVVDLPTEKGGQGDGFGPHQLLEAALATCITMTIQMHAANQGLHLEQARCTVRIDRSNPGNATLEYQLHLEGSLTAEQIAGIRQAISHCPVSQTLKNPIRILEKS